MSLDYGKPQPLEVKSTRADEWEVSGLLSTFGNVDDGGDVVLPGAFDACLQAGRKVKFLFAHDDTKPLGPPLQLKVTDAGLFATGKISKTALGDDVHTWLKDGALDSWSIGYIPTEFDFQDGPNGLIRRLKAVDLLEGSIVAIPMNAAAVVTGVKSQDGTGPGPTPDPDSEPPPAEDDAPAETPQEQAAYATVGAPGRSWEEHTTAVKAQCELAESQLVGLVTRARVRVDLRAKTGRRISQDTRQLLEEALTAQTGLQAAFDVLRQLLEDTAPPPKGYRPRLALLESHLRAAGAFEDSVEQPA